jgi:membrane protease YdiL (CAAX protease family)
MNRRESESRAGALEAEGPLPLRAVLPGLIYLLAIDGATVAGWLPRLGAAASAWPWVIAVLPWVTLLVLRRPPASLGYRRHRAAAEFGWGMVAGGMWRGLSMALSWWWVTRPSRLGWDALGVLSAVVWVPLVEETFFRGYLGRSLAARLGRWPAILTQALLFTLTPAHWAQGWPGLVSVFGFGLLAGWLTEARRSLWSAWGAHAFANILPQILAGLG